MLRFNSICFILCFTYRFTLSFLFHSCFIPVSYAPHLLLTSFIYSIKAAHLTPSSCSTMMIPSLFLPLNTICHLSLRKLHLRDCLLVLCFKYVFFLYFAFLNTNIFSTVFWIPCLATEQFHAPHPLYLRGSLSYVGLYIFLPFFVSFLMSTLMHDLQHAVYPSKN